MWASINEKEGDLTLLNPWNCAERQNNVTQATPNRIWIHLVASIKYECPENTIGSMVWLEMNDLWVMDFKDSLLSLTQDANIMAVLWVFIFLDVFNIPQESQTVMKSHTFI